MDNMDASSNGNPGTARGDWIVFFGFPNTMPQNTPAKDTQQGSQKKPNLGDKLQSVGVEPRVVPVLAYMTLALDMARGKLGFSLPLCVIPIKPLSKS